MSTAPTASEPVALEQPISEPGPSARTDTAADFAIIVAALTRMSAAARADRTTLDRLRSDLCEMAQTIAMAKSVADAVPAETLLEDFDQRVQAMLALAGGAPDHWSAPHPIETPTAGAEMSVQHTTPDQVPTVSDVVARQGGATTEDDVAPADAESGTTVAMLTAMVQALSDSIVEPPPPTAVENRPPEPTDATPGAETFASAWVNAPDPELIATPAEEAASPPPPLPVEPSIHEVTLLANLERIEARPFPPPDLGTAVIFAARSEPVPTNESVPPATAETPAVMADPLAAFDQSGAAVPQPDAFYPEGALDDFVANEPECAEDPGAGPTPFEALLHSTVPEMQGDAAPAATPPDLDVSPASIPPRADPDFDPDSFLFDPEPDAQTEPEPFLLMPAPNPEPAGPSLETASETTDPPPSFKAADVVIESKTEADPSITPDPDDPLQALNAMSADERIALFT